MPWDTTKQDTKMIQNKSVHWNMTQHDTTQINIKDITRYNMIVINTNDTTRCDITLIDVKRARNNDTIWYVKKDMTQYEMTGYDTKLHSRPWHIMMWQDMKESIWRGMTQVSTAGHDTESLEMTGHVL